MQFAFKWAVMTDGERGNLTGSRKGGPEEGRSETDDLWDGMAIAIAAPEGGVRVQRSAERLFLGCVTLPPCPEPSHGT